MAEAGFTKGPWKAGHYSSIVGLPITAQPDPKANTLVIAGCRACVPREEVEANARLIAAAPDLYEALKGIVDDDDAGVSLADQRARSDARMAAAKAAILKATGA